MFAAVAIAALISAPLSGAQVPEKSLTVDAIFAHGGLVGKPPQELNWSPDGKHLTYLDGGQLMDVDPASGRTHVLVGTSKMAQLGGGPMSERDRDHRERYGMASYVWAPDSEHILFDSNGRLWLYNLHDGIGFEMGFAGIGSGDDPKFSPDASCISFVRDHGLAVIRLHDPGTPTSTLAPAPGKAADGSQPALNGEVDWVYEEELGTRSNYFWSPDSKNLAYLQSDESAVPQYPLTDWIPKHALVDWQRYPQPGDANPTVRVGVVSAKGGKTIWVKLPMEEGEDYVPRFGWVDNRTLWVETLSRDQRHRRLYFADAAGGDAHQTLEISDDKFVDMNYDLTVSDGAIVLTHWEDGHNHIYLYSYNKGNPLAGTAQLTKQLTKGDFEVGDVYIVDVARKIVNYASSEGNQREQQIWQVSFDGERKQLSAGAGFHEASFSPDGLSFSDKFATRMRPPVEQICRTEKAAEGASACRVFWETKALDTYKLHEPAELDVKAHDGTVLYTTLLLPITNKGPGTVPLIVNPYGGPGEAGVTNEWKDDLLFDELLAQQGFAVLHTDNRGMGGRGKDFAQAAYRNFGPVQLDDQLTAVDAALARYSQLDSKRLGWWGWSWGGTFTIYAMTHSDRFRAGVAVAPVTDWHNYDSIYTERYLGLPAEDQEGYRDFSVVNSVARLKGRLLLAHGTGDDNVHIENTIQLVQKLIDDGIPYDLQIYPRKTHSLTGDDVKTHLYKRILAQFEGYLTPGETTQNAR